MKSTKTCKGCKWLSFSRTSKNHNLSGRDCDIYYCLEPERLENIGYIEIGGNFLYGCHKYTNIQIQRKEKLEEIDGKIGK